MKFGKDSITVDINSQVFAEKDQKTNSTDLRIDSKLNNFILKISFLYSVEPHKPRHYCGTLNYCDRTFDDFGSKILFLVTRI